MNIPELVLGYVRVSTDRQDLSVDAQKDTLQRALAYKCPGAELRLFTDDDTSGSIDFLERPGAHDLMAAAQTAVALGRPVVFMATKLDRMGRSMIDVDQTCTQFERIGVRVMLLDVDVDTRTAVGKFFLRIVAAAAELELARIKERIQTALDHKRSNNLLTGTVPYGWNAVETGNVSGKGVKERRLVGNPDEQKWILHMVMLHNLGWSYNKIAGDLNNRSVPTKRRGEILNLRQSAGVADTGKNFTKGKWQFGQVAKILQSKTVQAWLNSRSGDDQRAAA